MTTFTWAAGVSGDWGMGSAWLPDGAAPNAGDAAVLIDAPGDYTVTIANGEGFVANTVSLDSAGAMLSVQAGGTLTLDGAAAALTVTAGIFDLAGLLVGGTVTAGIGGTLQLDTGATLENVTWQGPLAVGDGQTLTVLGGLTVEAAGGAPGSIDLSAGGGLLNVQGNATLNNVTLDFGGNSDDRLDDPANDGATLTLGGGFTLTQGGGTDILGAPYYNPGPLADSRDTLINNGTIDADGGTLAIYDGTFSNTGSIAAAGGDVLVDGSSFGNSGSISIAADGTLDLSNTTLANDGQISIGAGGELILNAVASDSGGITLDSVGTLDLQGPLTDLDGVTGDGGVLLIGGSLDLGGGTLDVRPTGPTSTVEVSRTATLADGTVIADGGTLALNRTAILQAITWQGPLTFAYGQQLNVVGGLTVEAAGGAPGSIDLSAGGGLLDVLDSETLNTATLNFGQRGSDSLYNATTSDATLTLGSGFVLQQRGGQDVLGAPYTFYIGFDALDTLVNAGGIAVGGGDLLVEYGTLVNTGSIAIAGGGTLDLSNTALTNDAQITIGAGGNLILGAVASGGITFDGAGTLVLDAPGGFVGTMFGFAVGDTIDLPNVASLTNLTEQDGQITFQDQNGVPVSLDRAGGIAGGVLQSGPDGNGGVFITEITCFCAGTRIRTPTGEVPVEALRQGDAVTLADGSRASVRWLGRQSVARRFADPLTALPIRIRAGSLAEGLPVRDLLVSPSHAILLDDALVQAGALVNGVSITRVAASELPAVFAYYHVELGTHALLLAEGVPAESFVDHVERVVFDNWAEHAAMFGETPPIAEMPLPRAKAGRQVAEATRRRLSMRSRAMLPAAA